MYGFLRRLHHNMTLVNGTLNNNHINPNITYHFGSQENGLSYAQLCHLLIIVPAFGFAI